MLVPVLARGDAPPGPEAPLLLESGDASPPGAVAPLLPVPVPVLLESGDASPGPEAPLFPGMGSPAGICPAQLGTAARAPIAAAEKARTSSWAASLIARISASTSMP